MAIFSKFTAPVKNTITAAVQKPSLKTIAAAALLATPIGLVGTVAVANSSQIKNTLASASAGIKNNTKVVATAVGTTVKKVETKVISGVKTADKAVSSVWSGMMMPLMVVGGLGVAFMLLRK